MQQLQGGLGGQVLPITIVMWIYFMRCAVSNDLARKGNLIFQNRDATWQNHHTASWNRP